MARRILLATAAIVIVSAFALAATKPDFSGTWVMDRERSYGLPRDMNQTLVIVQKDDQIELETKLIQPNNERSVKDTIVLDGKDHEFTPQVAPNQPPAKGKRSAIWLPGDKGIQVTDVTTAETEKGPATTQIVRKWTISSAGELVIDMYVDNPNMSYEAKRIFKKQ
ncbi:MAG TPA: hypothetical protein VJW17_12345 [Pyrinomonadaceae bacterium]|nr:hypothetical protein [Pyrinomonadaceae bacterium]